MSLFIAGELDWMTFKGPFQLKLKSMILRCQLPALLSMGNAIFHPFPPPLPWCHVWVEISLDVGCRSAKSCSISPWESEYMGTRVAHTEPGALPSPSPQPKPGFFH